MERLAITTLATQDISDILNAATYTAAADKELLVCLYLSGVAGNGNYRACTTKQLGGAGTVFQGPTAVVPVATGVTTCMIETTPVAVKSGDVLNVWVQGLASDTSVGVVTEVFDVTATASAPTVGDIAAAILVTPANRLDTDASGYVKITGTKNTLDDLNDAAAAPSAADIKTALEADGSKLDHLWEMTEDDGGVRRLTANALEEGPSDTGLDAAGVRTAIGLGTANLDTQLANIPADVDTELSATHGAGAWGEGVGASSVTYTVTVNGLPKDGVYCRMTSDAAGLVNVDAGYSNALGQVTFYHDIPSGTTVYIWRQLAGVSFVNPDSEVIP